MADLEGGRHTNTSCESSAESVQKFKDMYKI